MFGVVPRTMWSRHHEPDDKNRIRMTVRCLLAECGDRRVLVDTGLGDRWEQKHKDIYVIERSAGHLVGQLAAAGVSADAITDVVLTHLHFDHAGGATVREGDSLRLQFPGARHYVQKAHLAWALKPSMKDRASFMPENIRPLVESGRLEVLDGPESPLPDLELVLAHGHTPALQAVLLPGEHPLFFPSDLVPMAAHVRLPYVMGYDNHPLTTLEEKATWLARAADEGWWVVFQHDPLVGCARIIRGARDFEVGERLALD